MAFDLKAICDAYAARYAPGTITTPTGAAEPMRASFAQSPVAIPSTPAVYIEVDDGEIVPGTGSYTVTNHLVINFCLSQKSADTARVEAQRQIWLPTLLGVTFAAAYFALGLAPAVKSAIPARYEWAEIEVGGQVYDGIRIFSDVICRDIPFS